MKHPEAAALVARAQRATGSENPTELSKKMGWNDADQRRKLYKWAAGEAAPNFYGTLTLLRLADGLREEDEDPAAAAGSVRQILQGLVTGVAALSASHREALADLQDVRTRLVQAEAALAPPRAGKGKRGA